jgi:hypothetical protein
MRVDLRDLRDRTAPTRYRSFRVFLDGNDVSDRCFLADDEQGIVGLYLRDESGHFYRQDDGIGAASEFRRGTVTLVAPPE